MVSGFIRSHRITTFVAIGGISIAAVATLYILLRRKTNQKEKKETITTSPPPSSSSAAAVSADQEIMSRTSKTSIRENNILPNSTTTTSNVNEINGKNKENAPIPEIITMESHDPEILIKSVPESSPNENDNSSSLIEEQFNKLEVSKNGAETIERELSPIEKILAENTPHLDWAECSFQDMESETDRNGNCGQTCTDSSSTHSNDEKMTETTVVTHEMATNGRNYKMADSPSVDSTHSEVSNDSGRATVLNPSGFIPYDFDMNVLPMYEFEVPNTLVGLIIGVRGKTIRELCTRADVRILIRPHHDQTKVNTHQICSIEGKRDDINKCLHMMRHRFPPNRFPDLNLKPVFPPPVQPPVLPSSDLLQLSLPSGVTSEVYISAPIDAGHFFVQLPTHPTFPSLITLDAAMNNIYYQSYGAQDTLKPIKNSVNIMCAAPASNGWYRALTLCYDEKQDEMLVRFVDYGGYARMARTDLRYLLRHDLLTLPYQSIECYLADVEPIDGTTWSEEANTYFQKMCTQKIIQAELVGHNRFDGLPFVRLLIRNKKSENVRFDTLLLKRKYAKPWDSSRCVPLPLPKITVTNEDAAEDSDATLESPIQITRTGEKNSNTSSRSNSRNKKSKGVRAAAPVAQTA
jgi:A-kinase anchor protein 1|uniref:Tudor domain-containing protein n=1 Tax=Panagrolaimus sp. PS1159 TaxID=55785 RepID=A0AC35F9R3_9BILA